MRYFRGFLIAASLALCACTGPIAASDGGLPAAPAEIAETTALDEQVALSVELAYQAAGLAVKTAADSGILRGDAAASVAALDRKAYGAVRAVRKAYDTGNAASYGEAAAIARSEIASLLRLVT